VIDLRESSEELVAAGVSQIAFVAVVLVLFEFGLAPATPEFVAAWVVGAVWSTVAYFIATGRLANQRPTVEESETLVSDERGQLTGGPTLPLGGLAALVAAIVVENFATTAGPQLCQEAVRGCSSDPTGQLLLLGAATLFGFVAAEWIFNGGRDE
jgi:hypothetical protein